MVFIVCIFHNKIDNLKAKLLIMFSEVWFMHQLKTDLKLDSWDLGINIVATVQDMRFEVLNVGFFFLSLDSLGACISCITATVVICCKC